MASPTEIPHGSPEFGTFFLCFFTTHELGHHDYLPDVLRLDSRLIFSRSYQVEVREMWWQFPQFPHTNSEKLSPNTVLEGFCHLYLSTCHVSMFILTSLALRMVRYLENKLLSIAINLHELAVFFPATVSIWKKVHTCNSICKCNCLHWSVTLHRVKFSRPLAPKTSKRRSNSEHINTLAQQNILPGHGVFPFYVGEEVCQERLLQGMVVKQ